MIIDYYNLEREKMGNIYSLSGDRYHVNIRTVDRIYQFLVNDCSEAIKYIFGVTSALNVVRTAVDTVTVTDLITGGRRDVDRQILSNHFTAALAVFNPSTCQMIELIEPTLVDDHPLDLSNRPDDIDKVRMGSVVWINQQLWLAYAPSEKIAFIRMEHRQYQKIKHTDDTHIGPLDVETWRQAFRDGMYYIHTDNF